MPECQLVERAQRGDLQAFVELVTQHRRMAFAVAYARLGEADDAHDAVQEAFIEAFFALPRLQDAEKFRAWFTTILTRRCARLLAARRKQAALQARAQQEYPVTNSHPAEHPATVFDRLSPDDRDLLTRSVLDGYSYAEIAAQVRLPVSTVRSRLHRARRRLYQEVYPMTDAATLYLTREVIEHVLLRLTGLESPISPAGLRQAGEQAADGDLAAITNGLAWLLEHGEPLERAFLLTRTLPPGLCDLIRLGRETGRSEMMFHAAAALLKVGLLQPQAPVSATEAANFFAYFSCLLQAGIPVVQTMTMAGQHVPALAPLADDITTAWRARQAMGVALDQYGHIFTDPTVSLLLLAESTGRLDNITALLAALLWHPEMLQMSDFKGTWEERLRRAEGIMRAQGRFVE